MAAITDDASPVPWWRVILVGRNPQLTLWRILLLIALTYLCRQYVVLPIRVDGISMLPTYRAKTVNFVNRLAYQGSAPQRGDVVAIRMAGEHVMLLKRVVGLPGETVAFRHGRLLIDGQSYAESYVKLPCLWEMPPVLVGANEYYVVGDNRSMSIVDHDKGRANIKKIVGKAML